MTREEFVEDWAVAQIMPGPNVVNLSLMLGRRYFVLKGAMAALAGMLAAPLVIVLFLAAVHAEYATYPGLQGALRGMGAVAAGLIAATGSKLFGALKNNVLGLLLCVAPGVLCFIAIALLRWPLAYVLLVLGGLAATAAYRNWHLDGHAATCPDAARLAGAVFALPVTVAVVDRWSQHHGA